MPHTLDKSLWPLVRGVFSGAVSVADMRDHQAQLEAFHAAHQHYALIVDVRAVTDTPPTSRRAQADWLKNNNTALKQYAAGIAFAVSSPVIHGVMTALFWVSPPQFAHRVARDRQVVADWILERMHEAKLAPIPSRDQVMKQLALNASIAA